MNTPWTYTPSGSDDPWDAGDYRVTDAGGEDIFLDTAYYPVAPDRDEAAHIVKCVNAHDKLVEALRALTHAVCGETGFAEAIRHDSGFAYPWPALDEAEALARAALEGLE